MPHSHFSCYLIAGGFPRFNEQARRVIWVQTQKRPNTLGLAVLSAAVAIREVNHIIGGAMLRIVYALLRTEIRRLNHNCLT